MSISSYFVGISGGLLMSIIAFSIVFIVITGLILLMYGLKGLAAAIYGSGKAPAESVPAPVQAAPAVQTSPAVQAAPAAVAAAQDDGELLAVITAAIVATCGTAAQVVSFREAPRGPVSSAWRTTGRLQNCEGFID